MHRHFLSHVSCYWIYWVCIQYNTMQCNAIQYIAIQYNNTIWLQPSGKSHETSILAASQLMFFQGPGTKAQPRYSIWNIFCSSSSVQLLAVGETSCVYMYNYVCIYDHICISTIMDIYGHICIIINIYIYIIYIYINIHTPNLLRRCRPVESKVKSNFKEQKQTCLDCLRRSSHQPSRAQIFPPPPLQGREKFPASPELLATP